jgi:hypothetical protein
MASDGDGRSVNPDDKVAEMLSHLNLTVEEEEVVALSDDEEEASNPKVEWVLLGKVLITDDGSCRSGLWCYEAGMGQPGRFENQIDRCEGGKPVRGGV